jgi:predicted permease
VDIALVILPDFLLIVIGLVLARRFGYERGFWEGLEKLVYYVLFPALLFRSLATGKLDYATALPMIAVAWAFTLSGMLLAALARPLFKPDATTAATCFQCGFRFNTYIGLALAASLYGQEGVALLAVVIGAMIPLANFGAVAALARHGGHNFWLELARNPLVVSTLAGFAWNAAGLPVPGAADHTLQLLAQTALPAGLLSVGAALRIEPGYGPWPAHAWWLFVKLAALPLVAWGLAQALGLGPMPTALLVLTAALPTASSAYVLAVRMAGEGRAVATQITLGTLASMLTIPFWISLLAR